MAMSSLQQRAASKTCSNSTAAANAEDGSTTISQKNDNDNRHTTFESCFSAGLDLSEFATTNNNNNMIISASAELAQSKQKAVERRNIEEKAEYELERRVANVVDTFSSADSCNDRLGDVVPRAVNPNNNILATTNEYEYHNEYNDNNQQEERCREDNFVQFQDSTSDNNKNEFLSCLISNHKVEQMEGRISTSHKSRITKKKNLQNNKLLFSNSSGGGGGGGRQHSKKKMTSGGSSSRKVVGKKSRKSKY